MGWISRQTRLDVMVNISMASQSVGSPKVKEVVELNKVVKMLKESPEAPWRYISSELAMGNCVVVVYSDPSIANIQGGKSQCGYAVGLSLPKISDGEPTPVVLLETTNHTQFDQASLQEHISCRISGGGRLRISLATRDDEPRLTTLIYIYI